MIIFVLFVFTLLFFLVHTILSITLSDSFSLHSLAWSFGCDASGISGRLVA